MSASSLLFLLETTLYGLLAYIAVTAATAERLAGRDQLCHHHRFAAVVYALLGASHLLHS